MNVELLKFVRMNPFRIKDIEDQTEEICLAAVKRDGYALEFVKEQTEEICIEAVRQNCYSIQFVENQTFKTCAEFLNKIMGQYVKDKELRDKVKNCLEKGLKN